MRLTDYSGSSTDLKKAVEVVGALKGSPPRSRIQEVAASKACEQALVVRRPNFRNRNFLRPVSLRLL